MSIYVFTIEELAILCVLKDRLQRTYERNFLSSKRTLQQTGHFSTELNPLQNYHSFTTKPLPTVLVGKGFSATLFFFAKLEVVLLYFSVDKLGTVGG